MSGFHELFDEPAPEHDLVAADLRRELQALAVPFDPQRADDMIAAATAPGRRRAARVSAPLATAAAVLVVGAGVAVFAATGGSDSALPSGGAPPANAPRPPASHAASHRTAGPNPGYGIVECASGGSLVGRAISPPRPAIARRARALPVAPGRRVTLTVPMPATPSSAPVPVRAHARRSLPTSPPGPAIASASAARGRVVCVSAARPSASVSFARPYVPPRPPRTPRASSAPAR